MAEYQQWSVSKWFKPHRFLVACLLLAFALFGCAQPEVKVVDVEPEQTAEKLTNSDDERNEMTTEKQPVEANAPTASQVTAKAPEQVTIKPANASHRVDLSQADIRFEVLQALPAGVSETSGLARRDGLLWTINDSGDQPYIYQLTQGATQIKKRHKIRGASNQDWESLAQDEQYLYVADCGNNSGKRSEFQIYRVPWQQIDQAGAQDYVSADSLHFSYQGKQGQYQAYEHNYDCEAITKVEHELWLFSKNWADEQSQLYRMDPNQKQQRLTVSDTLNVQGLVTAADYRAETGYLALLGYSKQRVFGHGFIWLYPVVGGNIDVEAGKRFVLPQYAQWEAIVWQDDHTLLLTTESSVLMDASLAKVTFQ